MNDWRKGNPPCNGQYQVMVRYDGDKYAESIAQYSSIFGGIWANMNIPSNRFDEIVGWKEIDADKFKDLTATEINWNWINVEMALPQGSGWYLVLIETLTEYVPLLGYYEKRWFSQLSYPIEPKYWTKIPEIPRKEIPYTFT